MNYYNSNFYPNYPYGMPAQQQPYQVQAPQQPSLNGKIVDTVDIVRATQVPFGGYGVFPKADMSQIYIKTWNNNGTTNITTFKPIQPIPVEKDSTQISMILDKIQILQSKLDTLITPKKEVKSSDY